MPSKEELIKKIKQKKELSGIPDKVISEELDNYQTKLKINYNSLKPKQFKLIVKDIRSDLRKCSGMFCFSAKERLDFYPNLKKEIKTLDPQSILDLGCGLNPIYLSSKKIKYYAVDINENYLEKVKSFFAKNKIPGKTIPYDLRKIKTNLPKADLCLIMKVFDVLENKGHKLAEKILNSIHCKYILISFSTKTLSGRPMNHPQRGWIERLLTRLEYKFKTLRSSNEIFYLAEKS